MSQKQKSNAIAYVNGQLETCKQLSEHTNNESHKEHFRERIETLEFVMKAVRAYPEDQT